MDMNSHIFISICHSTFLFFLLMMWFLGSTITASNLSVKCIKTEREALLGFKDGLTDPSARLSSWVGDDCCNWRGVTCDNATGHVFNLNLKNPAQFPSFDADDYIIEEADDYIIEKATYRRSRLGGEVNPSLLGLKYLKYLDLSLNDFNGTHIPKFLGSLHYLTYLNLSHASFTGEIPPHLGNLTSLHYLDLNGDSLFHPVQLHAENLWWLSGLSSLEYLSLGYIDLSGVGSDWLHAVNMLPSLLELHLPRCQLKTLPPSFPSINFTSLSVLDISGNWWYPSNINIPHWLFNLTRLTALDLSSNEFGGSIPGEIGNLTFLQHLDLSYNNMEGHIPRNLGKLCELKVLDLNSNYELSGDIKEVLGGFSGCPQNSLLSLNLGGNNLVGYLPESLGRLENLRYLDLRSNSLVGNLPHSLWNLSYLQGLRLSGNQMNGTIPESIGQLSKNLINLELAQNSLWGSIPASIGNLSHLRGLDLSYNQMNGTIPESIGQLSELVSLNLDSNSWQGVLTEAHFLNLTRLESLSMSSSVKSLRFNMHNEWIFPSSSLELIGLKDCQVGPKFPVWLNIFNQSKIEFIDLINVGISESIPGDLISNISSQIVTLDLSHNQIKGKLPQSLRFPKADRIVLSYNLLEGPLPLWSSNLTHLYINNNWFSGVISPNLSEFMSQLQVLDLSGNLLTGSIPSSIGELKFLKIFAVRGNHLSGVLPNNWNDNKDLELLDLGKNRFSGEIPKSLGCLEQLRHLNLNENQLEGKLPSSLRNCKNLVSLDVGGNNLSGYLPLWIGELSQQLQMLRLRSNFFTGELPQRLCHLSQLHILDLAQNNFSGFIPNCLGSITSLVYNKSAFRDPDFFGYTYPEKMNIVTKGREYEYEKTLAYVNCIDISQNHLMGEIPEGITSLSALGILNLSMNHLTGSIPGNIGNLRWLETFDLSNNTLSGPIPPSISSLTSLNHFNLSYNNLTGRIPSGNQLQTLNDSSIYQGNPFLCGVPSQTKCPGDETSGGQKPTQDDKDEDKSEMFWFWFYISIGPGFVVGFWCVFGTLLVKRTWRRAYFQFVEDVGEWIALMLVLKVAALRRKLGFEHN